MTSGMIAMPKELMTQIEDTARTENRQPEELVADAVRKYLRRRKWQVFLDRAEQQTNAKGLTEDDVPRLIEEFRQENGERGV